MYLLFHCSPQQINRQPYLFSCQNQRFPGKVSLTMPSFNHHIKSRAAFLHDIIDLKNSSHQLAEACNVADFDLPCAVWRPFFIHSRFPGDIFTLHEDVSFDHHPQAFKCQIDFKSKNLWVDDQLAFWVFQCD